MPATGPARPERNGARRACVGSVLAQHQRQIDGIVHRSPRGDKVVPDDVRRRDRDGVPGGLKGVARQRRRDRIGAADQAAEGVGAVGGGGDGIGRAQVGADLHVGERHRPPAWSARRHPAKDGLFRRFDAEGQFPHVQGGDGDGVAHRVADVAGAVGVLGRGAGRVVPHAGGVLPVQPQVVFVHAGEIVRVVRDGDGDWPQPIDRQGLFGGTAGRPRRASDPRPVLCPHWPAGLRWRRIRRRIDRRGQGHGAGRDAKVPPPVPRERSAYHTHVAALLRSDDGALQWGLPGLGHRGHKGVGPAVQGLVQRVGRGGPLDRIGPAGYVGRIGVVGPLAVNAPGEAVGGLVAAPAQGGGVGHEQFPAAAHHLGHKGVVGPAAVAGLDGVHRGPVVRPRAAGHVDHAVQGPGQPDRAPLVVAAPAQVARIGQRYVGGPADYLGHKGVAAAGQGGLEGLPGGKVGRVGAPGHIGLRLRLVKDIDTVAGVAAGPAQVGRIAPQHLRRGAEDLGEKGVAIAAIGGVQGVVGRKVARLGAPGHVDPARPQLVDVIGHVVAAAPQVGGETKDAGFVPGIHNLGDKGIGTAVVGRVQHIHRKVGRIGPPDDIDRCVTPDITGLAKGDGVALVDAAAAQVGSIGQRTVRVELDHKGVAIAAIGGAFRGRALDGKVARVGAPGQVDGFVVGIHGIQQDVAAIVPRAPAQIG